VTVLSGDSSLIGESGLVYKIPCTSGGPAKETSLCIFAAFVLFVVVSPGSLDDIPLTFAHFGP
jgi:hypothetical protein